MAELSKEEATLINETADKLKTALQENILKRVEENGGFGIGKLYLVQESLESLWENLLEVVGTPEQLQSRKEFINSFGRKKK